MKSRWNRWYLAALVMLAWGLALPSAWAQLGALSKYVKAEDFKMPMAYYEGQYQGQARAIISAKEARPLSGAKSYLLKEMKLEMFHETGERELVVLSPECVFNSETMVASSARYFQLWTTNEGRYASTEDKGLFLEGEGYEWSHNQGRVVVSNKVHTVLRRQLFADATVRPGTPLQPLEIFSDQTDISLTNRIAHYTRNVRVVDPRTEIKCEDLMIRGVTGTNSQVDSVVAERNVSILNKQDQTLATGQKAVYSAAENEVTLTGSPTVETAQGKIFGDLLVLNRGQNELTSKGNVRTTLKPGATNSLTSPRQAMELSANDMKVNLTNRHAVYTGNVRAEDDRLRVNCDWLTIDGAEKGGADRILAKQNVEIINKEDKSRATGDEALFVASSNIVTLTGKAMLENSQGRMFASSLVLHRNENELFATNNVKMEVQGVTAKNNSSAKSGGTNTPLLVFADGAHINLTNRHAVYTGNVRADDSKMLITSDQVTVKGQSGSNRIDTIIAEGRVTMTNRLDRSRATGSKAVYRADGEAITLTGMAMLENDQGKLAGNTIVLNQLQNLLTADGNVRTELHPRTTASLVSKTNAPAAAPEPMTVSSGGVKVNLTNRVAHYTGNVRVDSTRMQLECREMTVKSIQGTNAAGRMTNGVERIEADGQVLIINKEDNTRATGTRAVYLASTDSIDLLGTPVVIEKQQGNFVVTVEEKVTWDRASNSLHTTNQMWASGNPRAYQKNRSTNAPPPRAEK